MVVSWRHRTDTWWVAIFFFTFSASKKDSSYPSKTPHSLPESDLRFSVHFFNHHQCETSRGLSLRESPVASVSSSFHRIFCRTGVVRPLSAVRKYHPCPCWSCQNSSHSSQIPRGGTARRAFPALYD